MKSSSGPLKTKQWTRDLSFSVQILNIQPSGILGRGFEEPVDTLVTVCSQTRHHNSDDLNRRGNWHFDFVRDGQIAGPSGRAV